MTIHKASWIVSVVVLNPMIVPLGMADQAAPQILSVQEFLTRYTQVLDATQSFTDAYEMTSEFSYNLPNGWAMSKAKKFVRGMHRADGRRVYNQAYTWGDFNAKEVNLPENKPRYHLRIETDRMLYTHATAINNPRVKGCAYYQPAVRETAVISRQPYSGILGFVGADERLDKVLRRAPRISVRRGTEDVNGFACHVIDANTKYGSYTVWLDSQHGYNAARVTLQTTGGQKVYEDVASRGDRQKISVDVVRFERIDGVWVPLEGWQYREYVLADSQFFNKERAHLTRTRITLNPDHETLGSFADPLENPAQDPEFKDGTPIIFGSSGRQPMKGVWQGGRVVDSLGQPIDMKLLGH